MKNTENKENKEKVIFRKSAGEVFAIFPEQVNTYTKMVAYFVFNGGHAEGDYISMIYSSKPAKEEEYAELKAYLEKVYEYSLIVRKKAKINYSK